MIRRKKGSLALWGFVAPALALYSVFSLLPLFGTVALSFTNYNGALLSKMKWVGFRNYVKAFTADPIFLKSLWNNTRFTIAIVIFQLGVALLLALILYKKLRGGNLFKTVYMLPIVLSNAAVSIVWSYIFDPNIGVLNSMLAKIGLGSLQQVWLANERLAMGLIVLICIWGGTGVPVIIFITGLQAIPYEVNEAAIVDGANAWTLFRRITLPFLMPMLLVNVILTTINGFKVFDVIVMLTYGTPNNSTMVLAVWSYQQAFANESWGYATAIGVILLIIVGAISVAQRRLLSSDDV